MKKIVYVIFDNFEEIESIVPIDLLRRAGACVEVATLSNTLQTRGRSSINIIADKFLKEVDFDFDMLVISGGAGVFDVIDNKNLLDMIVKANASSKLVAAICAAPLILKEANILAGKCTGHTSIKEKLGNLYIDKSCHKEGNVITAQGAGSAFDFAFELIENLYSNEKVLEIKESICYKG